MMWEAFMMHNPQKTSGFPLEKEGVASAMGEM